MSPQLQKRVVPFAYVLSLPRYWPYVDESKLVPDYSGVRPKLTGPTSVPRPDGGHRKASIDDSSSGAQERAEGRDSQRRRAASAQSADDADDGSEDSVVGVRGLEVGGVMKAPKSPGPPMAASAADFVIQGPEEHGVDGLVNLFGIESPGLTASLAIAEHVTGLLRKGEGGVR